MQFDAAPLHVVRSVTQRGLALYWDRLRKSRPLPIRSEFEPEERTHDPRQLAFYSVEQVDDRRRYKILHWGSQIAEAYDLGWTGKHLDEILPATIKSKILAAFETCVQTRSPIYMITCVEDAAGKSVDCERLLLPFGDGIAVAHIVASLQLISIDGAFEQQNIFGDLTTPLDYSIAAIIKPGFSSTAGG